MWLREINIKYWGMLVSSEDLIEVTGLDVINQFRDETQLFDERHIISDEGFNELKEIQAIKQAGSAYILLEKVGEGAMGLVHLAKNRFLRRKVAFKELHSQMASDENHGRFLNEVQITAQLDHPNIVPVYTLEVKEDQSIAYAMKLVEGKTFKELIAQARAAYSGKIDFRTELTMASRLAIFLKVCDAMAFSHNKGILHRDLKPANLMIGPFNEVYVMDWGIARRFQSESVSTEREDLVEITDFHFDEKEKGQLVGTPRYMSPEQAKGLNHKLDQRSDLYALGLILYELVTLRRPVKGKTMIDVIKKAIKGQKEPYQHYSSTEKIPPELKSIIDKATLRKRGERYEHVQEFADDIRRFLRGDKVFAHQDTSLQKLMRLVSRYQQTILLLILGIVMTGTLSTLGIMYYKQYALAAAEIRKEKLDTFFTAMSDQSQQVNSYFLKLEGLLKGLAASSELVLERGERPQTNIYESKDFKYLTTMPFDLKLSKFHGRQISLDWPSFQLSSGINRKDNIAELHQLATLKPYLKRILLESERADAIKLSREAQQALIMEKGTPVVHSYIQLKKGYSMFYPGSLEPSRLSENNNLVPGANWQQPVMGPSNMGLILSCLAPIYNKEKDVLGYVGIDSSFHKLLDNYMSIPNWSAIQETYLVNEEGSILLRSSDNLKALKDNQVESFFLESVIEEIKAKRSGYIEEWSAKKKAQQLYAYYRLNSVGWYFIIDADLNELLQDKQ